MKPLHGVFVLASLLLVSSLVHGISPSNNYHYAVDDDQPTHESIAPFDFADNMEEARNVDIMAVNVDEENTENELDEIPTRTISTMYYYYAPSSAYTAHSNPYAAYLANNNRYYRAPNNAYNNYVTYPNNNAYYAAPAYNNMYGYNNPYVASATGDVQPAETDEVSRDSTVSTNTTHTNTTHHNGTANATNISAMEHANVTMCNETSTTTTTTTNTTHTNGTAAPGSNNTGNFNATVSLMEEHHRHRDEASSRLWNATHNTTHPRNASLEHSAMTGEESRLNRNVTLDNHNPSTSLPSAALTSSNSNNNNNNNNNNNDADDDAEEHEADEDAPLSASSESSSSTTSASSTPASSTSSSSSST